MRSRLEAWRRYPSYRLRYLDDYGKDVESLLAVADAAYLLLDSVKHSVAVGEIVLATNAPAQLEAAFAQLDEVAK